MTTPTDDTPASVTYLDSRRVRVDHVGGRDHPAAIATRDRLRVKGYEVVDAAGAEVLDVPPVKTLPPPASAAPPAALPAKPRFTIPVTPQQRAEIERQVRDVIREGSKTIQRLAQRLNELEAKLQGTD